MAESTRKSGRATALLGALVTLAAASPACSQTVGIASAVVNDVKVSNTVVQQPHQVVVRQQMALADLVQTGQRSYMQMTLLDRSTFSIGANARITIDRFVYDPARARSFTSSIAKGAFRFLSGERSSRHDATVNTPVSTLGIRGTIAEGLVGEDAVAIARDERIIDTKTRVDTAKATLVLLRGPGAKTQGGLESGFITVTAAGQTVSLNQPSLAVFVAGPDVPPSSPFMLSKKGLRRFQELLMPPLGQWRRSATNSRRRHDGRMNGGWDAPPPFEFEPMQIKP